MVSFVSGFFGSACMKPDGNPSYKRFFCTVSINGKLIVSRVDRKQRSVLFLERGIAFGNLGNINAARKDFRKAILDATDGNGPQFKGERQSYFNYFEKLENRMADGIGINSVAQAEWENSLSSFHE